MGSAEVLDAARDVLRLEADALLALSERLSGTLAVPFTQAVETVVRANGRVVVTGIGKSGAVARKSAATLASTGSPAFYLHPAEGVHGDLGMVTPGDVVIALSYSGETDEINAILPTLKRLQVTLIAVTGKPGSSLGSAANIVLDVSVEREACPHNLAPTTSTTAMLALMDALAVTAMRVRQFSREEYALFHPAGSLGRRLLLRVADLMRTGDRVAVCGTDATVHDALFAITRAQSGTVFIVDEAGRFLGILTDGDIRRLLLEDDGALRQPVGERFNRKPRTIHPNLLVSEAAALMQEPPGCLELPVLDSEWRPVGVLNIKDVARAGIF